MTQDQINQITTVRVKVNKERTQTKSYPASGEPTLVYHSPLSDEEYAKVIAVNKVVPVDSSNWDYSYMNDRPIFPERRIALPKGWDKK